MVFKQISLRSLLKLAKPGDSVTDCILIGPEPNWPIPVDLEYRHCRFVRCRPSVDSTIVRCKSDQRPVIEEELVDTVVVEVQMLRKALLFALAGDRDKVDTFRERVGI